MSERQNFYNQIHWLVYFMGLFGLTFLCAGIPVVELFWLIAVCLVPSDLQKGLKLLSQQATELRRTHFGRPPPKPNPPLSKRLQKLAHKALLSTAYVKNGM